MNTVILSHTELPPSGAPAVPPAAVQGVPKGKQHRDGHKEGRLTSSLNKGITNTDERQDHLGREHTSGARIVLDQVDPEVLKTQ